MLPSSVSFTDTINIAGELGKFNLVNLEFNLNERYNIWSGLIAGTFLFLSYFGTDQSQVARYLGGKSVTESRLGLMFNGLLKIPMQFMILFIGVLVFVFYLFNQAPVFHNQVLKDQALKTEQGDKIRQLDKQYDQLYNEKRLAVSELVTAIQSNTEPDNAKNTLLNLEQDEKKIRQEVKEAISAGIPGLKRKTVIISF